MNEILRFAQDDEILFIFNSVILSKAKDLMLKNFH